MTPALLALLACGPPPDDAAPPAAELTVDAGPDVEIPVGEPLTLTGSAPGATELTWDPGDGTVVQGPTLTHTYAEPGNYVAVLSAVGDGGVRRSDTARVTVYRPAADPTPVASNAIAVDPDRREVWVAVPEAGHLAVIDLDTGDAAWIPVCDGPRSAAAADGQIGVACEDSDELVLVDAATRAVTRRLPLGAGARPFGIAGRDGVWWATGQGRGELITWDGPDLLRSFPGNDPRGVAVDPSGAWYSPRWRSGASGRVWVDGGSITLAKDPGPDSDTQNRGVPTVLGALAISPDGGTLWVGGHVANVDRGLFIDGEPLDPGVSVRATVRTIDLTTRTEDLEHRKVFDNQGEVAALAVSPRGTWLWVAHRGNHTVHLLDAFTLQTKGSILDAGAGIDALAVSPDGATLLVHAWLDRTLHAWDISDPSRPTLRWSAPTVDVEPLDPAVLQGKRLFYDSRDPRLARDGYLSCGVCHPDGRDDGLTWDFTQRGEGLRNTISLEGRGGVGMGRLHWTGNFDEVQDFEGDIRLHQGGTGLLSDADWSATADPLGAPKASLADDLDALTAYVASLDHTPRSPYPTWADGEALFDVYACGSCHIPALGYTDSSLADPVRHDVGSLTDASGQRLGGPLDGLDTPTLLGVFATPPYLHDGRATALEAAIALHALDGPRPTEAERVALATFLRSL